MHSGQEDAIRGGDGVPALISGQEDAISGAGGAPASLFSVAAPQK